MASSKGGVLPSINLSSIRDESIFNPKAAIEQAEAARAVTLAGRGDPAATTDKLILSRRGAG
jgi:hypothetical protein